ncbi:hypothetical protein ACF0H5_021185 [Mactra antiquata]
MAASWSKLNEIYRKLGVKLLKKNSTRNALVIRNIERYYSSSSIDEAKTQNKLKRYTTVVYESDTVPGEKKDIRCELPATYSPQFVETVWYDWWVKQGYFSPKKKDEESEKFVICLPPPNVTGTLHLGHALTCSIQDALCRWHRMHGRETVWIPGSDHAGIATQVVVEKQLWKDEQKRRQDLGREEFLKRVWLWKDSKGGVIYDQMKRLGSSLDWSKEYFTMDQKMSKAVIEAFIRLYDEGLIYRNNKLVHWSCILRSTISDIEVENVSVEGPTKLNVPGYDRPQTFGEIISFDYPVLNSDERITVSTTRLETMLGDVAVCVHPDDTRYKHLHNSYVIHPIDGRHLPVICDTSVDISFGTGAVKITPAHDHIDYSIGVRHNLPSINVINDVGEMENVSAMFNGMKRFDARREVIKVLKEKGLFVKKEPHSMVLPICSRSKDVIEPRMKSQWFVDCDQMAQHACEVIENGSLKLIPEFYNKVWFEFMKDERSREWCISRQTWWGHRIPVYKVIFTDKETDKELWVCGRTEQEAYSKARIQYNLENVDFTLQQDNDVLDTWFSSALVPFSIHGWPEQTEDLRKYYPISLMETGNDILFFWVARMVMLGNCLMDKLPFNKVFLHGLLRDAHGRKMSKSLGNVIDPMDVIHGAELKDLHRQVEEGNLDPREIEKAKQGQKQDFPNGIPECGADALRFALCSYNFKDPEVNINILHIQNYRHFCNKIWNAYKFITSNLDENFIPVENINSLDINQSTDKWILSCLSKMVTSCDKYFENYELHNVTRALFQFWRNELCDIYLGYCKQILGSGSKEETEIVRQILYHSTDTFLRSVSPFMPYLSEELYQRLVTCEHSICVQEYPNKQKYAWYNESLHDEMNQVTDICTVILAMKNSDFKLKKEQTDVIIEASSETCDVLRRYEAVFQSKLFIQTYFVTEGSPIPAGYICREGTQGVRVHLNISNVDDPDKLINNFNTKITKLEQKLNNLIKGSKGTSDVGKRDVLQRDIGVYKKYVHLLEKL